MHLAKYQPTFLSAVSMKSVSRGNSTIRSAGKRTVTVVPAPTSFCRSFIRTKRLWPRYCTLNIKQAGSRWVGAIPMSKNPQQFGQLLREKRVKMGFTLREFAKYVEVSPTYLSHVELGKVERPPTAERLHRMAELLGEDTDAFITLAGRVPADLPDMIRSKPNMPALLRSANGLSAEQLRQLVDQANQMKARGGEA